MDSNRFDALTRRFAGAQTRRQLVQALGGGLLAAVGGLGRVEAAARGNRVCAQWCHATFRGAAAGQCTSQAAHGAGPCYSCAGPAGTPCADGETCQDGHCVASPAPGPAPCTPGCTFKFCGDDGCGGSCGTCAEGESCFEGECQQNCGACPASYDCSTYVDPCGTTLNCGTCTPPATCSGDDAPTPHVCGCTDDNDAACAGKCGLQTDNCGNPVDCSTLCAGCCDAANVCHPAADATCGVDAAVCVSCTAPQTCGGGGTRGVCGCTPATTCPSGQCGTSVPDGCGGTLDCSNTCPQGTLCCGDGTSCGSAFYGVCETAFDCCDGNCCSIDGLCKLQSGEDCSEDGDCCSGDCVQDSMDPLRRATCL